MSGSYTAGVMEEEEEEEEGITPSPPVAPSGSPSEEGEVNLALLSALFIDG